MCLYGSKMFAPEESECYGSEETLSVTIILPHQGHGTRVTGLWGAWGFRVLQVSLELSFDARKLEYTYPARCHPNVLLLIYGNDASDPFSGANLFLSCSCREYADPPALPFWSFVSSGACLLDM